MATSDSTTSIRSSIHQTNDFISAWPQGWTPRSLAYRRGFFSGYAHKKDGVKILPSPYRIGTSDCDAWFAGVDGGKLRAEVEMERGDE